MSIALAEASQLVLVDLQTRLLAAMAEEERAAALRTAGILVQAATALSVPLMYTEQYPKGLGTTDAGLATWLPEH
ncbi:MAG: hydrolase, partial [Methylococcaceae bacterium]|nr:hydrolase [Methylococcaceae bacterium]